MKGLLGGRDLSSAEALMSLIDEALVKRTHNPKLQNISGNDFSSVSVSRHNSRISSPARQMTELMWLRKKEGFDMKKTVTKTSGRLAKAASKIYRHKNNL